MQNPLLETANNRKSKCSYGGSQSFLNPVVKLHNCSNMKRLIRCSNLRVSSSKTENTCPAATVKELDPQKQLPCSVNTVNSVISTDSTVGGNHSKELESIAHGLANRKIKRILKVKWDFGKKIRNSATCSTERTQEDSAISVKQKTGDLKYSGNPTVNTDSSDPCIGTLEKIIDEMNNNKSDSVNFNLKDALCDQSTSQNKKESYDCLPVQCRTTQLPFMVSECERKDRESLDIECSALIRMSANESVVDDYSDFSLTEENVNFVNNNNINEHTEECKTCSCQRTIPFTGKTIWKCSCARTCVWAFPRKRTSSLPSTDILGFDSELSFAPYSTNIKSLFQANEAEPLQSTTDDTDSDGICKKLKLDFISENDALILKDIDDDILSHPPTETFELPNTVIEKICNITENVYSLGEVEDMYKNLDGWPCSSTIIQNTINSLPLPLPNNDKSEHFTTSGTYSEIEPTVKTVEEMALSSSFENSDPSVCSRDSSTEPENSSETVLKSTQYESPIHDCLDKHKKNTNVEEVLSFFDCLHETTMDNACLAEENCTRQINNTGGPLDDSHLTLSHVESPKKSKLVEYKSNLDVIKAYEEDVLFLDVVPDDPELFGTPEDPYISPICNADNKENNKRNNLSALMCNLQEQESAHINESTNDASPEENVEERSTYFAKVITDLEVNDDPLIIHNTLEKNSEDFYDGGQFDFEAFRDLDTDKEIKYAEKNSSESGSSFEESLSKDTSPGSSHSNSRRWRRDPSHTYKPMHWMNDFRYSGKCMGLTDVITLDQKEQRNIDNLFYDFTPIQKTFLPIRYCKYFFNTFRGCIKPDCMYQHVPFQRDEKVCMEVIHKLVNENHTTLLKRAVWIFTAYYRMYMPGVHYDSNLLTKMLRALYVRQMWGDVFQLLETGANVKILPSSEMLIRLFENIGSTGLTAAVPSLVDVFCKLVEAGMMMKPEQINMLITTLNNLQATKNYISVILDIKTRIEMQLSEKNWLCNLDIAVAEVGHCKEKNDWKKLGTLYLNLRTGCENVTDLKKFSNCIVGALQKVPRNDKSEIPYCDFADTVYKDAQLSEIDKNILGRIGISIMYHYYRNKQSQKGKRVLRKLQEMQINFTVLKGLTGEESKATRCQVVNTAVEIFLNCEYLNGALGVLRESEWIINTQVWPCERMDVLKRHNLLCTIAQKTLNKNMFDVCLEVLQNLPGLQCSLTDVDVSQYSLLFNKLLSSCIENNTLGVSSTVIDFMIAKKIPLDFFLLRALITSLGRSCLWLRARELYKCAVLLGCYPPMEGNLYRKVLFIPSFLSEIEMLLSIEIFMVSNASSIQSPGGSHQTLQIILKRCEEERVPNKDYQRGKASYQDAVDRLIQASRLSTPRLFIKHLTVNNANEQQYWCVCSHLSALCLSFQKEPALHIRTAFSYAIWPYRLFKRYGIPGPTPIPFIGTFLGNRHGLMEFDMKCFKKYGNVWGFYDGPQPVLAILDPVIIKSIMVKECYTNFTNRRDFGLSGPLKSSVLMSKDEQWKRIRTVLSPTFTSGKLKQMFPLMKHYGELLVKNIHKKIDNKEPLDMKSIFGSYSMDTILSTSFSVNVDSMNNPNDPFVTNARNLFTFSFFKPLFLITILCPFLVPFLDKMNFCFLSSKFLKFFKDAVASIKKKRQKGAHMDRVDFLQLMVDAQSNEGESVPEEEKHRHKELSDTEILAQSLIFIMAGYETTSTTLMFLTYNIARYPDVQRKLEEEINTLLPNKAPPTYDALMKMEYMDMVINETLRLLPPAIRIDRVCKKTMEINGVTIPAGVVIVVPLFALHLNPEIWPEPEEFQPERFSKENQKNQDPYNFLPFGVGPRNCIGMRFALVNIKLALTILLQNFKLETCKDTPVPLKVCTRGNLKPTKPIILNLVPKGAQTTEEQM